MSTRPYLQRSQLTDLQLLGGLKDLSWLSSLQLETLADAMVSRRVRPKGLIFEERGALSLDTYILLSGTAVLTHLSNHRPRVIAILSPGVVFRLPLLPSPIHHALRWIALSDCRVARLPMATYLKIILGIEVADYAKMLEAGDRQLGFLLGRYPGFFGLGLLQRVALALLQLGDNFGVANSHGLLLRIAVTQKQLADLVGASRAKVGQILLGLQRRKLVVREGRQLAVTVAGLQRLVWSSNAELR
jgi:CRP/FNR family transcriptional regulator, cyclic AMP receptor protein